MFEWDVVDSEYIRLMCKSCAVSHVIMDKRYNGWYVYFWFNCQSKSIANDAYDGYYLSLEKPDLEELRAVMEDACVD